MPKITKKSLAIQFEQFFSVDSPKAIKAKKFNYLNAIQYMSPARSGGFGNLCSHASLGCIALCLGLESGQAAMVSKETGTNKVRQSRIRKAKYLMTDRENFMREMFYHVAAKVTVARKKGMDLAVRPNGSTDVAYEGIRIFVDDDFAAFLSKLSGLVVTSGLHTVFSAFPSVQFLDYTKNPLRLKRANRPANYNLTFSLSETNKADALELLALGHNVAVVFGCDRPETFLGFPVIDGDEHDLRHLDPHNVIVGLTPKGNKAKKDQSGFVVRDLA